MNRKKELFVANIFSGQYLVTLDEKGRFSFPVKQLAQMGDERNVYINQGFNGKCLWMAPSPYWQELARRITSNSSPFDERTSAMIRYFVSFSYEQEIEEKTRRIAVNQSLLQAVGIRDKCVVVGMLKYFEIWNPDTLREYIDSQSVVREEITKELGGFIKF